MYTNIYPAYKKNICYVHLNYISLVFKIYFTVKQYILHMHALYIHETYA